MPILIDDILLMFALTTVGLGLAFLTFPMTTFLVKLGAMIKKSLSGQGF